MNATITLSPTQANLMTGEEFFAKHAHENKELRNGTIVESAMPSFEHSVVCWNVIRLIGNHVADNDVGRLCTNDTLIRLRKSPDTVRGPDMCYFSFARVPRTERPQGLCDVIPELACEVRSPSNSWNDIFIKVGEYLRAGIEIVLVFDADTQTVSMYRPDMLQQTLHVGETLELAELFPGFAVPVERFFA